MKNVIIDGDWGGDEMQLAAVLLAHPQACRVLGATSVFGNTNLAQTTRNCGDVLTFLGFPDVPYYAGCADPDEQPGDGAHGADGVGGVTLPPAARAPQTSHAVDFILDTLACEPAGSVTITATGTLGNIAAAFVRDADTMRRVQEIVIMGGCTADLPAADRPTRRGNITPDAEFNFFMDPVSADIVLRSGLPIALLPMNCTHQLLATDARMQHLRDALNDKDVADKTVRLICAPAELELRKFGIPPVMHDVNTALYILYPDLYQGARGQVAVTVTGDQKGHTEFTPDANGTTAVMHRITDTDRAFDVVLKSLVTCLA